MDIQQDCYIKKHCYNVTRPLSCDMPTVRHVSCPLSCDMPTVRHVSCPLSCDTPTVRHVTRPLSCDRFRELQEQREEKVHEAEVVRVRLEQSSQHRQLEHLKQLRDNIGEGGEEVG